MQCRYWAQGRGCFRGDDCCFKHDPHLRHQNVCYHWERGHGCKWGDACNKIHDYQLRSRNVCHRWQRGECTDIHCHRLHETTHSARSPPRQCRTPPRSRSRSLPGSPVSTGDLNEPVSTSDSDQPGCPRFPPAAKRMPRMHIPQEHPSFQSTLPPTDSSSGSQQDREDTIAQLIIKTCKDRGFDAASLTPGKTKMWRRAVKSVHPDGWTWNPVMERVMNKVMMWLNNERDEYKKQLHERTGA